MWIPGFGKYSGKPAVGDAAPSFSARNQDGVMASLADAPAHLLVVLVFYPRASSPICTKQMCSMRDGWGDLRGKATVYGVSYDQPAELKVFQQAQKLPFDLLSDPDKTIARAYGVAGLFAAARVSFVIGTDRRIKDVITDIKAKDHATQILSAL